jgi:hypothetical protein
MKKPMLASPIQKATLRITPAVFESWPVWSALRDKREGGRSALAVGNQLASEAAGRPAPASCRHYFRMIALQCVTHQYSPSM